VLLEFERQETITSWNWYRAISGCVAVRDGR